MNELVKAVSKSRNHKYPPASTEALSQAEENLGFGLPALLRTLYLEVVNGGFGPSDGVYGVAGGHLTYSGFSIDENYRNFDVSIPDEPGWEWPKGLVPFFDWGCCIYSCVDCLARGNPILWFDPNYAGQDSSMEEYLSPHHDSLISWFEAWLNKEAGWDQLPNQDKYLKSLEP